ncbi:hypothetical protein STEG23_012577 [Scotinomys teguina]
MGIENIPYKVHLLAKIAIWFPFDSEILPMSLIIAFSEDTLSLIISWRLFLLGEFASSYSRAFSFDLVDLSIGENGVLKSPTINFWDLMDDLSFSNVSFTYVGALVFGALMFRIDTSSSWIFPVIIHLIGKPFQAFYSEVVSIFEFECFNYYVAREHLLRV